MESFKKTSARKKIGEDKCCELKTIDFFSLNFQKRFVEKEREEKVFKGMFKFYK
jgi:hypothetical protein